MRTLSDAKQYFPACLSLLIAICVLAPANASLGQARVTRTTHPWGQFGPQSWSLVRKVSETYDESGKASGATVTETKTTLLAVDDDTYTVKIESTVEVAGKKIVAEPKVIRQTFEDLPIDVTVAVKVVAGDQTLEVEERRLNCQVYEIAHSSTLQKTNTKTYFCSKVAPYVLRRETTTVNATNGNTESQTIMSAVALDMPFRVVSENKPTVHFRTHQKHPLGSISTLVIHCQEVPGGLVSQSSKELDAQNRVIRRSTVELIDYSVKPADEVVRQTSATGASYRRRGWFRHRHPANECDIVVATYIAP